MSVSLLYWAINRLPERKAVFRRGGQDLRGNGFAADQTWVNSQPKKWRRIAGERDTVTESVEGTDTIISPKRLGFDETVTVSNGSTAPDASHFNGITQVGDSGGQARAHAVPDLGALTRLNTLVNAAVDVQASHASPASVSLSGGIIQSSHGSPHSLNHVSPAASSHQSVSSLPSPAASQRLATVQESCLLRYFIEELSPWFDHCDPQSHFRQIVPLRAQSSQCQTLLNAIFAVSSRHLSRLPQYKTPEGIIVYHGQSLPDLTTSSAVEYMLNCIPGLSSFHESDPSEQENLMCAAIILRQYEEMEEEMDEITPEPGAISPDTEDRVNPGNENGSGRGMNPKQAGKRVNFLAITQTIIHAMISSSSPVQRSSLAVAAYWIAIRQEVYYALTRKRAPAVTFTVEDWESATVANTMIMHAGEVTKWCWGERTVDEYGKRHPAPLPLSLNPGQKKLMQRLATDRLKAHQQHLTTMYTPHLAPILQKPADRSKGEIFPTVWYTTDAQVTGVQHLEMARMILIAENPRIVEASRTVHRKTEALVRSIVLDLCGIAVDDVSKRMPALVNAVISIMLYGEYFTDQGERDALLGVIERTKDMRAWPLRRGVERLLRAWREGDDVEV
ncbi:uncharacterized protein DSM5745_09479 [Aspergillus mulundensis]|uniref:ARCA protein n=1 Tax=Aspergillus mulundensis TaxID=1810919 RepID=A0A3D8QVQ3_9EURO|nr:hypothetical protein DSM5745_09479 [Aspergillus mulundensis]RDW65740.1 hypothetical protein DSM5745_09479 [Aspergillus mulundensis]